MDDRTCDDTTQRNMISAITIAPAGSGSAIFESIFSWNDDAPPDIDHGTKYKLTATPNQGWRFVEWEVVRRLEKWDESSGRTTSVDTTYHNSGNPWSASLDKGDEALEEREIDSYRYGWRFGSRRTILSIKAKFEQVQPVHTGLILRSASTGIILRRASTGVILRDD